MLKTINIDPESQQITIKPAELKEEAEARLHKPGPKTYVEKFLAGKTRLKKRHGWWPEEKRIEVASLYAAGVTNSKELERLTGIPAATMRKWKEEDWWPELLEKVHAVVDTETVSKFTKIVDKSLEVIQDRLNNGDSVLNLKTGEVYKKPVSMRDANIVMTTVVDKRQLLRGKATSRSEKVTVDDRLAKLADEFSKFAAAKDITAESKQIARES